MLEVKMRPGTVDSIIALRDRPFQLIFVLEPAARLYSFWLSEDRGGQSGGWLGSGGATYPNGLRDVVGV